MSHTYSQPPRAVASTPLQPAFAPTAPADEAGGRGNIFPSSAPVYGIEPVDGWEMRWIDYPDSDGFWSKIYTARRDDDEQLLHTCRFRFSPSQERFAWLVRNNFPVRHGKIIGPWGDTEIEHRIQQERGQ